MSVIWMLVSVVAYSFFPVLGALGTVKSSPFLFAGLGLFVASFALAGFFVLAGGLSADGRRAMRAVFSSGPILFWMVVNGVTNGLSHAFLFKSFQFIVATKAVLIFEFWPILAMYLMIALVPGRFRSISTGELLLSVVAIVGLVLISVGKGLDLSEVEVASADLKTLTGLAFAFAGCTMMAISVAGKIRIQSHYDQVVGQPQHALRQMVIKDSGPGIFIKLVSAATIFALVQSPLTSENFSGLSSDLIGWAIVSGTCIVALGSMTYGLAHMRTMRTSINVLWYLTPVLSLVWLWWLGLAPITSVIVIGAVLIIAPNLILNIRADTGLSYAGALMGLCLSCVYTFYVPSLNVAVNGGDTFNLFQVLAVLAGIFAILVAFMMDRLFKRLSDREDALLEVLSRIEAINDDQLEKPIVAFIREFMLARNFRAARRVFEERVGTLAIPDPVILLQLRRLLLSRVNILSFGEMCVLWGLGAAIISLGCVYRPPTVIGDMIAVLLSASVSFLCLYVLEQRAEARFHAATRLFTGGIAELTDEDLGMHEAAVISGVLLIGIVIGYAFMSLDKYGIIDVW